MLCWQVYEVFAFDRKCHGLVYAFFQKQIAFCSYVNIFGLRRNYLNFLWKLISRFLGCIPHKRRFVLPPRARATPPRAAE